MKFRKFIITVFVLLSCMVNGLSDFELYRKLRGKSILLNLND